jgi:hypothetical protein
MKASKGLVVGFWISTALFALQMSFTAYAQLRLPQVAEAFAHLGFPAYFRIELSWVKLAGVAALLLPMVPARGSRSGPTQASPSRSSRRWSPTSPSAMGSRRGAGRWGPGFSGARRTSSSVGSRPARPRSSRWR